MRTERQKTAIAVIGKEKQADFKPKWLIYHKTDHNAKPKVYTDPQVAETERAQLGDADQWEVDGPIEIAGRWDNPWVDIFGDPHILSVRFENVGTPQVAKIEVLVELSNKEVRRYSDIAFQWDLFVGSVTDLV